MAYLVVILAAFFSKSYFNSKLCRGEYGFFKTYFLYGGIGAFLIYSLIMFSFGYSAIRDDSGAGPFKLLTAARLALFCLAVYLSGIGLAVYRIKMRSQFSPLMNLYVALILIAFVILLPTALFKAPLMFAVYAGAVFVFYKFVWGGEFIVKNAATE